MRYHFDRTIWARAFWLRGWRLTLRVERWVREA